MLAMSFGPSPSTTLGAGSVEGLALSLSRGCRMEHPQKVHPRVLASNP